MYEVTATMLISAAHHLRGYRGKCENVHGHNYKVEATVSAAELDGEGLALDYGVLREHLRQVAGKFDHSDLNRHPEFSSDNPSSENLARAIFSGLKSSLEDERIKVLCVRVWESEGAHVLYRE